MAADSASQAAAEQAYLDVWPLVDLQFSALGEYAIHALAPKASDVIVDIGCGAGQTVLQLADRVGPGGKVIGVDIAPLLIECARVRAAALSQVSFLTGDATHIALAEKSADGVFSRFGVMRFADPVAAFANFHRLLKPHGKLAFVCWRSLAENELDSFPLHAAGLENRADTTPFGFADPVFTRNVLTSAGFKEIAITPCDRLVSAGGMEPTLTVLLKVGVLGKIVREHPELRESAEHSLRAALATKYSQDRIWLNAAIWLVTATA